MFVVYAFDTFGESFGYEDFYTARSVFPVFYTITVVHSFWVSNTTFIPLPRYFTSRFRLSSTVLLIGFSTHHSFSVTF